MTEKLPKGVCREILKMEREDVDMTERAAKARGKDPSLSAALETLYKAHCGRLEEIMRVYGFPTLKNGGAAVVAALMQFAVNLAARRKKRYVWLGVWEKNEKALRFYRKQGFYRIGAHPFVMGDDVQTDDLMRKDL